MTEALYCEVVKVLPGEEHPVARLERDDYPDEDSMKFAAIRRAQQASAEDYPWAYAARMVQVHDLWRTP
jgi:hypothetical protein